MLRRKFRTRAVRIGTALVSALLIGGPAAAGPIGSVLHWEIPVIGEDQVRNSPADPPGDGSTDSSATGWARIDIRDNPDFLSGATTSSDREYLISVSVAWNGLLGELTKIHIHGWLDPGGNPIGPNNSTPTHLYEMPGLRTEAQTIATGVDRRNATYTVTDAFLRHTHPFDDAGSLILPSQIIEEFVAGRAYFNIHSTLHPMGEIRGNLTPIPEPSAGVLTCVGLLLLASRRRNSGPVLAEARRARRAPRWVSKRPLRAARQAACAGSAGYRA